MARFTDLLVLKVEPRMRAELRTIAEREDRSVSSAVRRLLSEALASQRPSLPVSEREQRR